MLPILQRPFFPVKTFFEKILETEKSEPGSACLDFFSDAR